MRRLKVIFLVILWSGCLPVFTFDDDDSAADDDITATADDDSTPTGDDDTPGDDDATSDDDVTDDDTTPVEDDDATADDDSTPIDADGDGYVVDSDCNDADPAINPSAIEVCNGIDDDCDGSTDVDAVDAPIWYPDVDNDTFGAGIGVVACDAPAGYVGVNTDCDDGDALVSPDGHEVYFDLAVPGSGILNCRDGVDNDCDGDLDEVDTQCQDVDEDGIADGVDYLFVCDLDTDGLNEAVCLRADMAWEAPWDEVTCIQQVSSFTELSLDDVNELEEVTWGGETFEVCPIYPRIPGNQDARAASSYGVDGSSPVDTNDCSDWVPSDLSAYCGDWPDNLCTTIVTSDGCEVVGRAVSFTFDGTQVTP